MTQYVIKAERVDWSYKWVLTIYDDILNEIFERDIDDKDAEKRRSII